MNNLRIYSEKGIKVDKRLIHKLVSKLSTSLQFTLANLEINFVNPATILQINKDYLKHNYETDIITFNYSGDNSRLEGELFICLKVALDNALSFNVNFESEITRLIIHGLLHLIGYDDTTSKLSKIMKLKEDQLVNLFELEFKNIIIEYDSQDC